MKRQELNELLTPLHFGPSVLDDGYTLTMTGIAMLHPHEIVGKQRREILELAYEKIAELGMDYDAKIQAMLERIQMALDDSMIQ